MKTSRLLLAFALASAPLLASAAASISVDRAELVTDLVPNEKRMLTLKVSNAGSEATPITVYSEDWQIIKGEPDFNNRTHARALGRRVTVAPASFELAPGASEEVTVVVDAGPGKLDAGSYWSAIFVQSAHLAPVTTEAVGRGAQMRIVERIGVLLFADCAPEAKPLPADIAITDIKRTAEGLDISVKNPSTYMRLVSSAVISVTPYAGGDTTKIPFHAFRLLPSATSHLAVALPTSATSLGKSSVMAVIDYGAKDLVVGEARITF
jgi:P pilus assembly chaperone PapD